MSAMTVQQMADRVASLMEERLGVRGTGLPEKLRRGGRRLPRRGRRAAAYLAEVSVLAQNPKVQLMLDDDRIAAAYDTCVRHLRSLSASDLVIGRLLGIAGVVATAVLAAAALFIGLLVWRGFV
jgi:hypothetical protein